MDTKTTRDTISVLDDDAVVTESGRVFRPYHKEILDRMPADIVAELARRRLAELERDERENAAEEAAAAP